MKPINKIVISNRIYGTFNLIDFFDFKKGSGKISKEGKYPQLSSAKLNNGIAGQSDSWIAENCFSIASTGAAGWCFWHPYKLDATGNACIAIPKFKVGDNITMKSLAVYITSYLTYKRFFYGRVPSLCKLKKQIIALPIINDNIDWEFIRNSYLEETINVLTEEKEKINKKIENINNLNTGFKSPEFK
jgi:hypothetical protein